MTIHSSDDDEDCFWMRDAFSNIKKEAVSLNCNYANAFDYECSDSDEDSSSIEDTTDQIMAKRKTEVKERLDKAEEIYDSDDEKDTNIPADEDQKTAKKRHVAPSKPATKRRRRSVPTESTIEVTRKIYPVVQVRKPIRMKTITMTGR